MSLPDYMLDGRKERPTGISILSGLHILSCFLGIAASAFFLSKWNDPQVRHGFDTIGVSFLSLVFVVGLFTLLAFASGIAMWRGAKSGWYIGSFVYVYSIVMDICALFLIGHILS